MDINQTYAFGYSLMTLVSVSLIAAFLLMLTFVWIGWWFTRTKTPVKSLYTGLPVRPAITLPYASKVSVNTFMKQFPGYDNRLFLFRKSVFCRETGRIFPNTINWYGKIKLDWSFLQKRFPGHFVSWGSLDDAQKKHVRELHHSLEGFQTQFSSLNPSPRDFDPEYIYLKPGPLYVDIDSHVLLGWKCVPETDLEVLIVQRPKQKLNLPL